MTNVPALGGLASVSLAARISASVEDIRCISLRASVEWRQWVLVELLISIPPISTDKQILIRAGNLQLQYS